MHTHVSVFIGEHWMTAGELKIILYPKMWRRKRSLGTADLNCSCGSGPQAKPYFREKMRTIILKRSHKSVRRTHTLGCGSIDGGDPCRRDDCWNYLHVNSLATAFWIRGESVYSIWESLISRWDCRPSSPDSIPSCWCEEQIFGSET